MNNAPRDMTDDEIFTAIICCEWPGSNSKSRADLDTLTATIRSLVKGHARRFLAWFYITSRQYGGAEKLLRRVLFSEVVRDGYFSDEAHAEHVDMLLALPVRVVGYIVRGQPDWQIDE